MKMFDKIYDDIDRIFPEGLAWVRLNGKWGFADTTGREVIPCKYDYTYGFSNGLAKVELDGKWGYIDITGKEIIPCIFEYANYVDKIFHIKINGKYGCANPLGDIIVPCIYDRMPFLKDGKIKMTNDDVSTIYNLEGEIIF